MVFENYYYRITSSNINGKNGLFEIEYIPSCTVYNGHFPNNPVCPGVLNIELVRECTGKILKNDTLQISEIKQCRFLKLMTPEKTPKVSVYVKIEKDKIENIVTATIKCNNSTCMEFKGKMTV